MTPSVEKALLEKIAAALPFIEALARMSQFTPMPVVAGNPGPYYEAIPAVWDASRAYLSSLSPAPEPGRANRERPVP